MSYDVEALRKAKEVKRLIRALRYGDLSGQSQAAQALGLLGDKRAIRILVKTLKRGDTVLQVRAAEALGRIGGRKTLRPLRKAIRHCESAVNQAAALALGMTQDPRAIEPLCEALAGGDRYGLVGAAAKALGMIRHPGLVAPLCESLHHVGPRTVMVIHTLTETDNEYAFKALTAFAEKHPSPICQQWLEEMESRIFGGRKDPPQEPDATATVCTREVPG